MSLMPGDQVAKGETECTFVGHIDPHPLYPHLWMIICRDNRTGEWYHDAMSPRADLGSVEEPRDRPALLKNLRHCLGSA